MQERKQDRSLAYSAKSTFNLGFRLEVEVVLGFGVRVRFLDSFIESTLNRLLFEFQGHRIPFSVDRNILNRRIKKGIFLWWLI